VSVEIILEGHATTVDNERRIATGWLDGELSELGKRQAKELGERQSNADVVFASDLGRAVETADIAFAGTGIPVRFDARLRECNYGELNGASRDQVDAVRSDHVDEPFPDGESYRQCVVRMRELLDELARDFDGKRVLLIGHGATFYALEHLMKGMPLEELISSGLRAWEPGRRYVLG
jgi:broad specificity phosphatase PhoE